MLLIEMLCSSVVYLPHWLVAVLLSPSEQHRDRSDAHDQGGRRREDDSVPEVCCHSVPVHSWCCIDVLQQSVVLGAVLLSAPAGRDPQRPLAGDLLGALRVVVVTTPWNALLTHRDCHDVVSVFARCGKGGRCWQVSALEVVLYTNTQFYQQRPESDNPRRGDVPVWRCVICHQRCGLWEGKAASWLEEQSEVPRRRLKLEGEQREECRERRDCRGKGLCASVPQVKMDHSLSSESRSTSSMLLSLLSAASASTTGLISSASMMGSTAAGISG